MLDPEIYAKNNSIQRRDAAVIIPKYLELIQWRGSDDETLIDVGCGIGDVTEDFLRPLIPPKVKIISSDIQQRMLSYGQNNYPDVKHMQLDIGTTKLPKQLFSAFDHVFSAYCLHWIPDKRQVMQNIYDILKPGGDLFTYFLGTHPFFDVFLNTSKLPQWSKYLSDELSHFNIYQKLCTKKIQKCVQEMLEDIGFKISLCEVLNSNFVYPNLKALRTHFTSLSPHYLKLPYNLREYFIDDSLNELSKLETVIHINDDSCEEICIPQTLIVIVAKKV